MSTKLQADIKRIRSAFCESSFEYKTLENAIVKLKCLEEMLVNHESSSDAIDLAHEIDGEQEQYKGEA